MNLYSLKIGDLIVRQKGPFSTHYIVYLGLINGIQTVAENQSGHGVRYTNLSDALAGNPIKRFEKFGGTEDQRNLVIPRINTLLGKSYDLILFNCEHFARWIANGKGESKQVKAASNIAIVTGATALLASKSPAIRTIGLLGIAAGIIGHISQRK